MPDPNAVELDALSQALLERLAKEETRPPGTAKSHLLGGIAEASSKLEKFLREVVLYASSLHGVRPETLLASAHGPRGQVSLRKSMAGPLAHGLKDYFAPQLSRSVPRILQPICADLLARDSRILAFITIRNSIVKEGADPATGRGPAMALRALIAEFRQNAGWT